MPGAPQYLFSSEKSVLYFRSTSGSFSAQLRQPSSTLFLPKENIFAPLPSISSDVPSHLKHETHHETALLFSRIRSAAEGSTRWLFFSRALKLFGRSCALRKVVCSSEGRVLFGRSCARCCFYIGLARVDRLAFPNFPTRCCRACFCNRDTGYVEPCTCQTFLT
jgi:hypothetical protein